MRRTPSSPCSDNARCSRPSTNWRFARTRNIRFAALTAGKRKSQGHGSSAFPQNAKRLTNSLDERIRIFLGAEVSAAFVCLRVDHVEPLGQQPIESTWSHRSVCGSSEMVVGRESRA